MRARSAGFGLLEVILVFAVILGAAGVIFSVFHSAQVSAQASSETQFVRTASADAHSVFLNHNYVGISTWWNKAVAANAPMARSPNGYSWSLKAYKNSGDCNDSACPSFWFTYFYRDGDMPEEVCQRLVEDLSRDYFVNGANMTGSTPTPIPPATAAQLCDRSASGGAPLFLSLVSPY